MQSFSVGQGCKQAFIYSPVLADMFVFRVILLPAPLMGFMGTSALEVSIVPKVPAWRFLVSLACLVLCLVPATASFAQLGQFVGMLPPWSQSAAPEVRHPELIFNLEVSSWQALKISVSSRLSSGFCQSDGWNLPSPPHPRPSPVCFVEMSTNHNLTFALVGHYCPRLSVMPIPCPPGSLNTLEGALSIAACKPCPVRRYCSGSANWEPDGKQRASVMAIVRLMLV